MKTNARIVVVGGQKGGTGKSTIAQNLAVALALDGGDVMMIDTDTPQNTSKNWTESRRADSISPAIQCEIRNAETESASNALTNAIALFRSGFSHIVVDTGAADSLDLRVALVDADVLIAPFIPNQADLWTVRKLDEVARETRAKVNPRLRVYAVVSNAPANAAIAEPATAAEYLSKFKSLQLARAVLRSRMAYPRAMAEGRGVLDYAGADQRSRDEVRALYSEIFK
jgi:chromosome partitioning protein